MFYVDVAGSAAVSASTGPSYLTLCNIYLRRTQTHITHTSAAVFMFEQTHKQQSEQYQHGSHVRGAHLISMAGS